MLKVALLSALIITPFGFASADDEDVNYQARIKKGAAYCESLGDLKDLMEYAQDGDQSSMRRMLQDGTCSQSNGMRVRIFIQDEQVVAFETPSGNAFFTVRGAVEPL